MRPVPRLPRLRGSSPLVRGAHFVMFVAKRDQGIIPACAGSTMALPVLFRMIGDHPRLCGEHNAGSAPSFDETGSSPLVRGAPTSLAPGAGAGGIIPACAGSTNLARFGQLWPGDHPRLCGEHSHLSTDEYEAEGSSPLVRGALGPQLQPNLGLGIIPACAGSTLLLVGLR